MKTLLTRELDPPGIAEALGGLVGGTMGLGAGLDWGAAAGSFAFSHAFPILVMGWIAAAILTTTGTLTGVGLGWALDDWLVKGQLQEEAGEKVYRQAA